MSILFFIFFFEEALGLLQLLYCFIVFRSKFVASEMPQAFVYNVILNAYGQVTFLNKLLNITCILIHTIQNLD